MSISKKNLMIGLFVSAIAHGVLFLPNLKSEKKSVAQIQPENKVQGRVILPPAPKMPQKAVKKQPSESEKKPVSPMENLTEMVKARSTISSKTNGGLASEVDKDNIPELRVKWNNSEQLLTIAKNLGMRILAANGNDIVGELNIIGALYIMAFDGKVSNYSNRVRTVPTSFFGTSVREKSGLVFDAFIVLIPQSVDHEWISKQKNVIKSKGLQCSQVSYMEAKIIWNGQGYELVITRLTQA